MLRMNSKIKIQDSSFHSLRAPVASETAGALFFTVKSDLILYFFVCGVNI